ENRSPSLLLDEFDTFAAFNEDFRGVLNAGFDKDDLFNAVWICVGDDNVETPFKVWCPQAISGIGQIDDTVADRCIKIELERKLRAQKVARFRRRNIATLDELAQKCARWAKDNLSDLAEDIAEEKVVEIEAVNDRAW